MSCINHVELATRCTFGFTFLARIGNVLVGILNIE